MVYVCGILFLSCGVVMNVRTGLGVAPMSTVPYLMYIIEGLSLGTASFIVYCVFVVAQLLLVRYPDVKILLQIPVSLLFSVFIDVLDIWLFPFTATGLIDGLVMLVIARIVHSARRDADRLRAARSRCARRHGADALPGVSL